MNNALGEAVEDEHSYYKLANAFWKNHLQMEDDLELEDFDTPPDMLRSILENGKKKIKTSSLEVVGKTTAAEIDHFSQGKGWIILGNSGANPVKVGEGKSFSRGHFTALKKDPSGNWWAYDSEDGQLFQFKLSDLAGKPNLWLIAPQ